MDYSPPGSSAHGILQARTLEWVAMPFSKVPGASVRNPPVAKVMRKEARHIQRWDRASGVPLEILEHLLPKPESACFTVLCFPPTLLTLTGCCPPTIFFWKKLIWSFQVISLLGTIRVFQSRNPSDGFLACLQDSCACDCLAGGTGSLKHPRNVGASEESKSLE